jgi:hypothetical protein
MMDEVKNDKPEVEVSIDLDGGENHQMIDEDTELKDIDIKGIEKLMRNVKDMLSIVEQRWAATRDEFKLSMDNINKAMAYNSQHAEHKPEDWPEDTPFDVFNGIDKMTEEEAEEIFGKEAPIIGVTHDITKSRIKETLDDFYTWTSCMQEYHEVTNTYNELQEIKEDAYIQELTNIYENETDPEKKAEMKKSLDEYHRMKTLTFIHDWLDDETIKRVKEMMHDSKKATYLINRGRDKLKQLGISQNFLLEIAQYESRFMNQDKSLDNVILSTFMNKIVYNSLVNDAKLRSQAAAFVIGMDRMVRGNIKQELKDAINNNLITFVTKF